MSDAATPDRRRSQAGLIVTIVACTFSIVATMIQAAMTLERRVATLEAKVDILFILPANPEAPANVPNHRK